MCVAHVEGATQWLPRANTSFMLVLCSRQIPAKANKLILSYLILSYRYSNWPIIERAANGALGLIESLRRTFATYGVPDELASDGGPEFTATVTRAFLKT